MGSMVPTAFPKMISLAKEAFPAIRAMCSSSRKDLHCIQRTVQTPAALLNSKGIAGQLELLVSSNSVL